MWSACKLSHKSRLRKSHQGVLQLHGADSWRPSAPPARGLIKGRVVSHISTRSRFKLLPSKTTACWNSILSALPRLLDDQNVKLNYNLQELFLYIYFSRLPYCTTVLLLLSKVCQRRSRKVYIPNKIKHLLMRTFVTDGWTKCRSSPLSLELSLVSRPSAPFPFLYCFSVS